MPKIVNKIISAGSLAQNTNYALCNEQSEKEKIHH